MDLQGKRVVVTGADGFIGSHLVEALLEQGCSVKALACYNAFGSHGWLDTMDTRTTRQIEVVAGDVRDPNGMRTLLRGADAVFHLAALVGIPFSYHSPDAYVDTNIKGTLNILQASRDLNLERVVVTSTSEVYGTAQYTPINEQHPLTGQSPYAASKIGADQMAEAFWRSFDTPVVTVRPFNTYGPRQSTRAVVPTIITQLLRGEEKVHLGSLHPTRDLNYVTDTVAAFVALAQCDEALGMVVNVASGFEVSVGDLALLLVEILDSSAEVVTEDARLRPVKSEVERLLGDNTTIRALTDWEPRTPLKVGLLRTIEWMRENLDRFKLGYTV